MFQVNWVAQQTYLVNFWSKEDFDVINAKRWQWFGSDAAIIRIWTPDANLEEDALDSIPQLMILHDILLTCRHRKPLAGSRVYFGIPNVKNIYNHQ